jgi:hypothetical protein
MGQLVAFWGNLTPFSLQVLGDRVQATIWVGVAVGVKVIQTPLSIFHW